MKSAKYQERTTQLRESFDISNGQRKEIYRLNLLINAKTNDNNELSYAYDFITHRALTQMREKNEFIKNLINIIILMMFINIMLIFQRYN